MENNIKEQCTEICIYHSHRWEILVETGYITALVEGNIAYMLYHPADRR